MLPSAITLRNYRSFAGPQRLELRPITLLYGRNSAGKSSLLRSLPLIADSLASGGIDALDLLGRVTDLELDFDSLRWKGRSLSDDPTIGISLSWEDESLSGIVWSIWEEREWKRLVTKELVLRGQDGNVLLDAEWQITRGEERSALLSYRAADSGTAERLQIPFAGLAPGLHGMLADGLAGTLEKRLEELATSVLWLRALRRAPPRYTRSAGGARWELYPTGFNAPIILAGEPEVQREVSSWYEEHLGFELVVEESRPREVRVALRNRSRTGYDIDIIDTGEGVAQVLPVLTALAMAKRHQERGGPRILAIEDPEAHLHPDLQRALAERICSVVRASGARVVLETHSREILLAMQLELVKQEISPKDIILYWVRQSEDGRSIADAVELDELARFSGNWPPDAFSVELDLAADIQEERDRREGT